MTRIWTKEMETENAKWLQDLAEYLLKLKNAKQPINFPVVSIVGAEDCPEGKGEIILEQPDSIIDVRREGNYLCIVTGSYYQGDVSGMASLIAPHRKIHGCSIGQQITIYHGGTNGEEGSRHVKGKIAAVDYLGDSIVIDDEVSGTRVAEKFL